MTYDDDVARGDRSWLHRLRGSGRHTPASREETRAVVESLLGDGAVAWAVDVGHEATTKIVAEIPVFLMPGTAPDVLRMGVESSILQALVLLADGPLAAPVPPESLLGDREFARRGVPLEAVLRGIRLAHAVIVRSLLHETALTLDEPIRRMEMERVSTVMFDYIDAFASAMAEEYTREREQWLSSSSATRAETVRHLLDEHVSVDVDATSRTLSYPLSRHHVAAVVWRNATSPADDDLVRAAERLVMPSGLAASLVVADGTSTAWVWCAYTSAPGERGPLQAPAAPGLHVAMGSAGIVLAGFRRSHREAAQAAAVLQAITPMSRRSVPSITAYLDVELAVLAGQNLPLARGFVERELGPLAEDTPAAAELRQTVGAYLSTNRSLSHAAEALHVARNTVAYRIKKVETLLGRDLHHRRLELETALRLADQLGRAVLPRPER